MSRGAMPLGVGVLPDPVLLDRVVARQQVAMVLERSSGGNGYGNGSSNAIGNGNGQSKGAVEPSELDFAPAAPAAVAASEPALHDIFSFGPVERLCVAIAKWSIRAIAR